MQMIFEDKIMVSQSFFDYLVKNNALYFHVINNIIPVTQEILKYMESNKLKSSSYPGDRFANETKYGRWTCVSNDDVNYSMDQLSTTSKETIDIIKKELKLHLGENQVEIISQLLLIWFRMIVDKDNSLWMPTIYAFHLQNIVQISHFFLSGTKSKWTSDVETLRFTIFKHETKNNEFEKIKNANHC